MPSLSATPRAIPRLTTGPFPAEPYNFEALGADQHAGALHPLGKVRQEFRNIFFEMGFAEMPTSQFVESGFWVRTSTPAPGADGPR